MRHEVRYGSLLQKFAAEVRYSEANLSKECLTPKRAVLSLINPKAIKGSIFIDRVSQLDQIDRQYQKFYGYGTILP